MYPSLGAKDHLVFSRLPIPLKERIQLRRKYGKYYTRSFKPVMGTSQGKIGDPLNCRLKSAVVSVTLDEEHEDLPRRYSKYDSVPVQIIKHGPPDLSGEPDSASILKEFNATPQLDGAGMVALGGVGNGATIEWRLRESELGRQPAHDNTFHTGFAFQHGGQPFYIRVEVGGYLEGIGSNMRHKVTHKFKKFKFPATPQPATTLVDFGGRHNKFRNPLDELAQNLPNEMLLKNMKPVVRVPGKLPGNRLPDEVLEQDTPNYSLQSNQYNHAGIPSPHIPDTSESVNIEEFKRMMQALMSLGQPPIENINSVSISASPLSNSQISDTTVGGVSSLNSRAGTSIGSSTDSGQQQNEVTRSVTMAEDTNHEEVRKHVRDASLPIILELIILWILTVGSWMSPSKKFR
ncbi:uncharacterized protein F4812DRAFT_456672 [Daldinia caldariorum]|uniref:uncharacterized protein n=1 Tax=Daldinia caldariorum TaxID=326644 RepID=UPI002008BB1B|nr:uncharacterized protein F4812DRAFT_456672 [Daldinia caldariorum]KAI1470661.1 hypothetical protein F4812DRAFT_456672 [Daldinia caldariorum]